MDVVGRIESLSLALLLPLFFALTGLRTRIDLLTGTTALGYVLAILAVAVLGKLAGAALGAKIIGMNWKNSLGLGVLMNTRGLVELVILRSPRSGRLLAGTVHHDGSHGPDHDIYDQSAI